MGAFYMPNVRPELGDIRHLAYLARVEFVTGRLERKGEWLVVGKDIEISTVQEMPKVFDSLVD